MSDDRLNWAVMTSQPMSILLNDQSDHPSILDATAFTATPS
ncbi:hypothetical protein [Moraxella oculi]|nr:hypothetical protein [Moraxella sp. Tifton1]